MLMCTRFVDMSEEYTLSVPTTGSATLTAATTLGALRGLETFAQLIDFTARCVGYPPLHPEVCASTAHEHRPHHHAHGSTTAAQLDIC